jgi:hypothetical protein
MGVARCLLTANWLSGFDVLLEENTQLNQTLSEFMRPIVTRTTIENDGYGTCLTSGLEVFSLTSCRRAQHARNPSAQHGYIRSEEVPCSHQSVRPTSECPI